VVFIVLIIIRFALGTVLFLVVAAMLYYGFLIGWGFASDFRSKAARFIARSCLVLFWCFVVYDVVSRIIGFFE